MRLRLGGGVKVLVASDNAQHILTYTFDGGQVSRRAWEQMGGTVWCVPMRIPDGFHWRLANYILHRAGVDV